LYDVMRRLLLAAGAQDWMVEVASSSAVDVDGGFLAANVVDVDTFLPGTTLTSWTGSVPLDPGTYYVHVASSDLACATCPSYEWSAAKTLVVAAAATTAPATTTTTITPTTCLHQARRLRLRQAWPRCTRAGPLSFLGCGRHSTIAR
jgi:hypothetical protein